MVCPSNAAGEYLVQRLEQFKGPALTTDILGLAYPLLKKRTNLSELAQVQQTEKMLRACFSRGTVLSFENLFEAVSPQNTCNWPFQQNLAWCKPLAKLTYCEKDLQVKPPHLLTSRQCEVSLP